MRINPKTINFWEGLNDGSNMNHRFFQHPILPKIGIDFCLEGFDLIKKDYIFNSAELMLVYKDILRIESNHKEKLIEIGKNLIRELWKIDTPIEAKLTSNIEMNNDSSSEESEEEKEEPEPENVFDEVNKRITLNTLIQGCSINQLFSFHHLIKNELDELDKRLFGLYDYYIKGSLMAYWLQDLETLQNFVIGKEELKWEKDEPKIITSSTIFPILFHEMTKGVIELIFVHGISDLSPKDQENVIKYSDKIEYEPYQIQIGFLLWRDLLSKIDKKNLSIELMNFSKLTPNEIHSFLGREEYVN